MIVYLLKTNSSYKHLSIHRKINAKGEMQGVKKPIGMLARFLFSIVVMHQLVEKGKTL